jgi:CBS domain-containing protein
MPDSFKMDNLPFSLLDEREQALLRSHLDITYFQKGEAIIEAGTAPEGLYVILKGRVGESDLGETLATGEVVSSNVFVHY